jgi:hypothetical protein
METERPTPRPGDANPDMDDAPTTGDLAPPDTDQDPVEDPDAEREPGRGKS